VTTSIAEASHNVAKGLSRDEAPIFFRGLSFSVVAFRNLPGARDLAVDLDLAVVLDPAVVLDLAVVVDNSHLRRLGFNRDRGESIALVAV
jgi:hypothetical protein